MFHFYNLRRIIYFRQYITNRTQSQYIREKFVILASDVSRKKRLAEKAVRRFLYSHAFCVYFASSNETVTFPFPSASFSPVVSVIFPRGV